MYMIIYVCISFMRLSILFAKGGMNVLVMFPGGWSLEGSHGSWLGSFWL